MKVFRTLNIAHIIVTVFLFSYTFYDLASADYDTTIFIGMLIIPLLIIINCASNINLVDKHFKSGSLSAKRKLLFWLFLFLFILLTAFLIYTSYKTYGSLGSLYMQRIEVPVSFVIRVIALIALTCNSIYISIYQFYFFFSIRKNSKIQLESLVNEIGKPEQL
jgi:hypothetical protein